MEFVPKLNQRDIPHVISDEAVALDGGKWEGYLLHDNVNLKSLELYPQPGRQGDRVLAYTTEIKDGLEWRTWLRAFAKDVPLLYISYETFGDTVEADDVNQLQQAAQALDVALTQEVDRATAHRANRANPHAVTKAQVGLGSADNTPDMGKPVSTAQREALDQVAGAASAALTSHTDRTDNPHLTDKAQVGLPHADNTSDANKPVSTAQRAAIDLASQEAEAALSAHTDRTDNPHAVTKAQVGLGSADNTSDVNKPVSTAQRTALDKVATDGASALKSHTDQTDNPHQVTKSQVGLGSVPNVATNDQVPTYTAATALAGLASGEKLTVALGKLAKAVVDLVAHLSDGVKHLTAAERTLWNSVSGKVDKVSGKGLSTSDYTAAEKTKLAGVAAEANKYVHPGSGTNPHSTTKSDVGLGSVPNVATNDQVPTFTAATARANLVSGEKLTVALGKLAKWFTDLKTVAWTGSYNDLTNKPTIPSVPGSLPPTPHVATHRTGATDALTPGAIGAAAVHAHTELAVKPDNYKDGVSAPSTYPRGTMVFLSNAPANKFNGVAYCTVVTIKGYTNMACVQYIYPYNVDAPITYRYSLYNSDTWGAWRALSIDGHTHTWSAITGKPTTFAPSAHAHAWGEVTGKPTTFTPVAHTHTRAQISDFPSALPASGGTADYARMINGVYTSSGGKQAPSYIPSGKIRFNMMNTLGSFADWVLMDTYSGSDVPYVTAFGIEKTATPAAWVMVGAKNGAAWGASRRVALFTATPTAGKLVVTDGATGGVKSSGALTWNQLKGV